MNTNTITATKSMSSTKKAVATLLLALTTITGMSFLSSSPAGAVTAVSSCWKWSTGAAYANQPVRLEQWNGSSWVSIRNGKTNASGCGTFSNTPNNVYLRMRAYVVFGDTNVGLAIFSGEPNNYGVAGVAGTANLGTWTVYKVQCTSGLYGYCAGLANFR